MKIAPFILLGLIELIYGQSNNSSQPTDPDILNACKTGSKVGAFIITQPNSSSLFFVEQDNVTVKWKYSNFVTKLPQKVDLKIQLIAPGVSVNWKTVISKQLNVSNGATSYVWKPQYLVDGSYKLRLVADGKETFIDPVEVAAGQPKPCFQDGEALPGVSAQFRLAHMQQLTAYKDQFPPNSSSAKLSATLLLLLLLTIY